VSWFSNFQGQSGLGAWDEVEIKIDLHYGGSVFAMVLYYLDTSTRALLQLDTFGGSSAIGTSSIHVTLRRHPTVDQYMHILATGGNPPGGVLAQMIQIDSWVGNWAIVMGHSGIPAGGFVYWKWSVLRRPGI
jgi:hypothetical protein